MIETPVSEPTLTNTDVKLVLENVSVAFGDRTVVDGVDLEVAAGEKLAVVGPSGSGKSTLLRAIAGLEPLTGGRILLDGRDLLGVPTHRRGVGLMFQDHALFPHLSVADNIAYGLRHGGSPAGSDGSVGERIDVRTREMLSLVGLDGFGSRSIDQLSGGEAQRVALARALAPAPSLLMLDEPLGSLDRVLREQLVSDLDLLLDRMNQTALHVTHDQAEAFALADRVAVLTEGRLIRLGTPQELWEDPGTPFVATFLGRPNIWTVTVDVDGRVRWLEADRFVGTVSSAIGADTVVVPVDAVRTVEPTTQAQTGDALLTGKVTSSQFHQGRYRHRAVLDRGDAEASVVWSDGVRRRVGDAVRLTVDPASFIPLAVTND